MDISLVFDKILAKIDYIGAFDCWILIPSLETATVYDNDYCLKALCERNNINLSSIGK